MLDPEAGQAIATAYALGEVLDFVGPVDRGELGEVWRLTSRAGTWAVKVTFADLPEDVAEASARVQTHARQHGVPTPPVRLTKAGDCWARIGDTMVRVYGWVDLLGLNRDLDPILVGRTLATLHRAVLPAGGPAHWWYTEPVGAAGWDEMLAEARRQRAPFTDKLAGMRDELVAVESLLQPVDPVQICHLDLWADNVRATPDGGLCIVDWDNAGPGDPARELAVGGPGRIRTHGEFAMLIAQLHHICELHLRRWLTPGLTDTERARALAHIYEYLDDPLDRNLLAGILSVTRSLDGSDRRPVAGLNLRYGRSRPGRQ